MPRIEYTPRKFSEDSLAVISRARRICQEYADAGYDLTLRQLYYQFVARGWLANNDRNYKRLGSIVNDARLAGLIDWDHLTDRTRNLRKNPTWRTPSHLIHNAANWWETDKWADQDTRPEVWIEKDALIGVITDVCEQEQVGHFSCRGYTSQSEIWAAGQRIGGYLRTGQNVTVIHLGDHDPSGIDMSRDIEDRLRLFVTKDNAQAAVRKVNPWAHAPTNPETGVRVKNAAEWREVDPAGWETQIGLVNATVGSYGRLEVLRVALTWEQIEEHDPPPNPAKLSDSRATGYIDRFGYESWELDALPPEVLSSLVRDNIEEVRDPELWEAAVERQEQARRVLTAASARWAEVAEFLGEDA